MHRWLRRIVGLIMLAGILGGCVNAIMTARPLPAGGQSFEPVIAIQPNGTRHVAWAECPSGEGCRIIYLRTPLGGAAVKIQLIPPVGSTYRLPDVAATDNGTAYLVWRSYSNPLARYTPSYAVIPAGSTAAPLPTALGDSSAGASDAPRLVARGTNAYALYTIVDPSDGSIDLYQRRLSPLADAGTPLATSTNAAVTNPIGAIDSVGDLHVAYEYAGQTGGYQALFYNGHSGLHLIANSSSATDLYSKPDIALDANNTANVVYATAAPEAVLIFRKFSDTAGPSTVAVPFTADPPWSVEGSPHVAAVGSNALVSFVAGNAATTNPEVWYYSTQPAGPTKISTTADARPREALIAAVDGWPVIAWRIDPNSLIGCDHHAFVWSGIGSPIQVHASPDLACSRGLDMAASGQWVAGVGLDETPTPVPWVVFNAYKTFAPLTRR